MPKFFSFDRLSGHFGHRKASHNNEPIPPLFALIIGINTYASGLFVQLHGPSTDAAEFEKYFTENINVPKSHIQVLLNERATRKAIIEAFERIRDDARIKQDDAIFIFYAGHGGEAAAPADWEAGGRNAKIQLLMPQDFSTEEGKEVPGIPDFTVAALLNQIAKVKGDNITVVFDCCHSASASRGGNSNNNDVICRAANLPDDYIIPASVDRDIWDNTVAATRGGGVHRDFQHLGLQSYVLLSACQSFESAQESGGRGYFSKALLSLLRTNGPDKLKYSDIIPRLDVIPNQNPQCEGLRKDRHIFNRKVIAPGERFYAVRRSPVDPSKFIMDGGLAHGLSIDSEYSVYAQKDLQSQLLGNLQLIQVQAVNAIMTLTKEQQPLTLGLGQIAFATQTKPGVKEALRLYLDPTSSKALREGLFGGNKKLEDPLWQHVRVIATKPEDAHIMLSIENGTITITDPDIVRYGKHTRIDNIPLNPRDVADMLRGLAHYFWHLRRGEDASQLVNGIELEFFKLEKSETSPGTSFIPVGQNLYRNNMVELLLGDEDEDVYGIRLTNKTSRDIFPNLFYFDNSDFSIEPYYVSPPTSTKSIQEAPLKKDGTLTFGYGSGGCAPWSYYLREGEDIDVGFLKLFVFNEPIDLSDIPQPSPLEPSRGVAQKRVVLERLWGTLVIPVIQRRLVVS